MTKAQTGHPKFPTKYIVFIPDIYLLYLGEFNFHRLKLQLSLRTKNLELLSCSPMKGLTLKGYRFLLFSKMLIFLTTEIF